MPMPPGRAAKARKGTSALYAQVDPDVRERLDAGAKALGVTLARYLEEFVRRVPTDEHGLPEWVRQRLEEEQLPLQDSA